MMIVTDTTAETTVKVITEDEAEVMTKDETKDEIAAEILNR